MHLCIITNFFVPASLGGAEVYVDTIARAMRERGHRVSVVTNMPGVTFDDPAVVNLDLAANPLTTPLLLPNPAIDRALARVLEELGADVVHVNNTHVSLGFGSYRVAGRYPCIVTLHDYHLFCLITDNFRKDGIACDDTSQCGDCASRFYPARASAIARPTLRPIIRSIEGRARPAFDALATLRRLFRAQFLNAWVDYVVCPSQALASTMTAFGIARERLVVLPNGMAVTPAPPAAKTPAASGSLRIGYVGKLERNKGLATLFDALERTSPALAIDLTIVGEGPEQRALLARAAALGPGVRTEFLGRVPRSEIARAYERFDILVVPSIWPEVNPLVVLEGLAYGKVVVASEIGGMPDQLKFGGGLLVKSNVPESLAAAFSSLANDAYRRTLAAEARTAFERHFTIDRHVGRLERLYAEAILRRLSA